MQTEFFFEVPTLLRYSVRTTLNYWLSHVIAGHSDMIGREGDVQTTLASPDEIWLDDDDWDVFLFYRRFPSGHYMRVVTRRVNGKGFLIAAFPCHRFKRGERIWPT